MVQINLKLKLSKIRNGIKVSYNTFEKYVELENPEASESADTDRVPPLIKDMACRMRSSER